MAIGDQRHQGVDPELRTFYTNKCKFPLTPDAASYLKINGNFNAVFLYFGVPGELPGGTGARKILKCL